MRFRYDSAQLPLSSLSKYAAENCLLLHVPNRSLLNKNITEEMIVRKRQWAKVRQSIDKVIEFNLWYILVISLLPNFNNT